MATRVEGCLFEFEGVIAESIASADRHFTYPTAVAQQSHQLTGKMARMPILQTTTAQN